MKYKAKQTWDANPTLKQIDGEVTKRLATCARSVMGDAQRICPVKTGKARESIKMFKSKFKDGGWVIRGGGGDTYYFTFLELGSVRHYPKAPLRTALQRNASKIKETLGAK